MARGRGFDEAAVLDKAMALFWRRGYAATSIADLCAATGLKPGSLYGAFVDKETLFRRAFERYAGHFRATLPSDLEGLAAIEAWIGVQRDLAAGDAERKGCLIVNTVVERDVHAEATRALAQERLDEIRRFFARELTMALRRGELREEADLEALADALLGTVVSLMTLGRAGVPRAVLDNVAAASLAALPRATA
jgi:TetR/AcrR family transcriptional repressor of nem operon